ncbi:MAG TPA: inorganic phosphate transporter [Bacteroidales bacterium]|nr:inorganic phosphate transporter [Bacteroidales bacterium]
MLIPFLIPFIIGIFLAINMGGSGIGPSFSAAYGANVIRRTAIPGLFGIMVFLGAILGGEATAKTIGNNLLSADAMTYTVVSIILLSVAISLFIANLLGVPQSTSQSTVMAVTAPALYLEQFNSHTLFVEIIPTWFITPVAAFLIALFVGKYIYKPIRKTGITISKQMNDSYILKGLILVMALYVAFSIGANNVANAVGPISSMAINELNVAPTHYIHIIILSTLIIAPSFAIGSSLLGKKVLQNTGKEIVLFGKIEAVIIAFISASLLLGVSLFKGIPTSLVQLNVGAILGIGVAKLGFKNIFSKTEVNKFFVVWIVAPIIAFSLSLLLTYIADGMGILNYH